MASDAAASTRADLSLIRAQYPKEVPDGSLIFARHGHGFYPAIKWSLGDAAQKGSGLAYLCKVDEGPAHPYAQYVDDEEPVLLVKSDWYVRPTSDWTRFKENRASLKDGFGLAIGAATFLAIRLIHGRETPLLIDLATGKLPQAHALDSLIFVGGFELHLVDQEEPLVRWPPKEASSHDGTVRRV